MLLVVFLLLWLITFFVLLFPVVKLLGSPPEMVCLVLLGAVAVVLLGLALGILTSSSRRIAVRCSRRGTRPGWGAAADGADPTRALAITSGHVDSALGTPRGGTSPNSPRAGMQQG